MHEPVLSHLENMIARTDDIPAEAARHLETCASCRQEWLTMQAHCRLIRTLKPDADAEPFPGFYARVLDRIEQMRPAPFWAAFLEPVFGRRLAVASAVLAVLMGIALVTGEPAGKAAPMPIDPTSLTAVAGGREDVPAPVLGDPGESQEQVRNAVFVSLATYRD